jgi:hypothetical protein
MMRPGLVSVLEQRSRARAGPDGKEVPTVRPDPRPRKHAAPRGFLPRRRTDLAEAVLCWVVGIGGLVALLVALVVGMEMQAGGSVRAQAEAADRTLVPAVLQASSAGVVTLDATSVPVQQVPATWTGPDGRAHAGQIDLTGTAAAGTTVSTWVDRSGAAVAPPLDPMQVAITAVVVGTLTLAGGALLLLLLWIGVRSLIDRRNHESWATEWALVEPAWSGRA